MIGNYYIHIIPPSEQKEELQELRYSQSFTVLLNQIMVLPGLRVCWTTAQLYGKLFELLAVQFS